MKMPIICRPEVKLGYTGKSLALGKILSKFIMVSCIFTMSVTLSGKVIRHVLVIPKIVISGDT